jgi:hypothetical protein
MGNVIIEETQRMNWLKKQMIGRYGFDQLSIVLLVFSFLFSLIAQLTGLTLLMYLGYIPLAACIYRALSRQIQKRRLENSKFMTLINPAYAYFYKIRKKIKDHQAYKYFKCPKCKQGLRVPRGKGTVVVTCSKCRKKFDDKT